MTRRYFFAAIVLLGCGAAQTTPQLKVRLVLDKDVYAMNEKISVKAEVTNGTSDTLCFPVPDQECESPAIGWLITTGESVRTGEGGGQFICHLDGGGYTRRNLDSAVRKEWVRLAPNETYVMKTVEANVRLDAIGQWTLTATYHPPEGSFSPVAYRNLLKSAAKKAGCVLPDSVAVTEPKLIEVRSAAARNP